MISGRLQEEPPRHQSPPRPPNGTLISTPSAAPDRHQPPAQVRPAHLRRRRNPTHNRNRHTCKVPQGGTSCSFVACAIRDAPVAVGVRATLSNPRDRRMSGRDETRRGFRFAEPASVSHAIPSLPTVLPDDSAGSRRRGSCVGRGRCRSARSCWRTSVEAWCRIPVSDLRSFGQSIRRPVRSGNGQPEKKSPGNASGNVSGNVVGAR